MSECCPTCGRPFRDPKSDFTERNDSIVSRVEAGEMLQAIGDDLGITSERVRQIYTRATGQAVAPIRMAWRADAVRLFREGMTIPEIVGACRKGRDAISKALRQAGISETALDERSKKARRRPRPSMRRPDHDFLVRAARRLREQRLSYKKIGDRLGLYPSAARFYVLASGPDPLGLTQGQRPPRAEAAA